MVTSSFGPVGIIAPHTANKTRKFKLAQDAIDIKIL